MTRCWTFLSPDCPFAAAAAATLNPSASRLGLVSGWMTSPVALSIFGLGVTGSAAMTRWEAGLRPPPCLARCSIASTREKALGCCADWEPLGRSPVGLSLLWALPSAIASQRASLIAAA